MYIPSPKNPLILDTIVDEGDKRNLHEIDEIVCSFYNSMPVLTKHVPTMNDTHYVLHYIWDDEILQFSAHDICRKLLTHKYVMDVFFTLGGMYVHVYQCAHMKMRWSQGRSGPPLMSDRARTRKRGRESDDDDDDDDDYTDKKRRLNGSSRTSSNSSGRGRRSRGTGTTRDHAAEEEEEDDNTTEPTIGAPPLVGSTGSPAFWNTVRSCSRSSTVPGGARPPAS